MMVGHYFDMHNGSLVESYLKEIIVGINKQIEKKKKNRLHFIEKLFKTNLTCIFEAAKLQLNKRRKFSVN